MIKKVIDFLAALKGNNIQKVGLLEVERMLVVTPHMDDEILGCGGLLALRAASGRKDPRIIYVTDGSRGTATLERDPGLNTVRKQETREALAVLGIKTPDLVFLDRPDFGLEPDEETVEKLAQAITECNPTHILASSPWDSHHDHKACSRALEKALRTKNLAAMKLKIVLCEIYTPLVDCQPVDITSVMEIKKNACLHHVSQQKLMPYGEYIAGLNLFRGMSLAQLGSKELHYGEGYLTVDVGLYQRIVNEMMKQQCPTR